MKMYDVIVERRNGIYHASAPALPGISVEGSSRDEAILKAKEAIEDFFKSAEVTTVAIDVPADEFRPYSKPSDWLRWAALYSRPADENDSLYQEYLAELAAEKQRQREEAEREADLAEAEYPFAERWLLDANLPPQDPNDALYQQYLVELTAEKQRQREAAEREAELAERGIELAEGVR